MVKTHYEHLVQRRLRWFVRIVVPADVRAIIGKTIFMKTTGCRDQHQAALKAVPIISEFQRRITVARDAGKRLEQVTAEQLAEKYRAERSTDPEKAELTKVTDIIEFVLKSQGHDRADFTRQVREADYDLHAALRMMPDGGAAANAADRITGHATPFLTYLATWKPHSGLLPRSLDQAVSTIAKFDKAVGKTIEQIEARDVQKWIDKLIDPDAELGRKARTVKARLSEIGNYWRWLQSHQIVPGDRNPFSYPARRIQDPAHRKLTKEAQRQRFRPEDVVRCWREAERRGDTPLVVTIKIAAYSGARIEAICRLKSKDINIDPNTKIRFMQMADKTDAGNRFVPIHSELSMLIDQLVTDTDKDDYLIASSAKNKYGERSQPIGKRFGRLKTDLGFDNRFVFHSIRKTIAHMFETLECPPGVAKDILGHVKTDMTFGIYSGETRMDHRARWMEQAIGYPAIPD